VVECYIFINFFQVSLGREEGQMSMLVYCTCSNF